MTLYRGTFLDTPQSPFRGHHLRADQDAALLVRDGVITARGPADVLMRDHPDEEVVDLRHGLVLPGLIDTHVHFPQVRAIGGLGMPLLDWLERCALPEEARLADATYAASVAADFVDGLARAGTTTALVFGSHFATAVDALFAEATRVGLRVTSGLVLSDRILREDLFTDPDRAYAEGLELATRWHGCKGRTRYAVTPRFSLSCTNPLLAVAGELLRDVPGSYFTSHLNENPEEIRGVRELFGCDYTATYDQHGLLTERSVLAHNVHPTRSELQVLGRRGVSVAHCPTSNAALGSGLFPLGSHLAFGVRVALGSDVGRGHRLLAVQGGPAGVLRPAAARPRGPPPDRRAPAAPRHRGSGADALGLSHVTGDLSVSARSTTPSGSAPPPGTTLDVALRHAESPDDALAKAFALATPADVRQTWVAGEPDSSAHPATRTRSRSDPHDESRGGQRGLQRLLGLGDREAPALGERRLGRYGDLLGVGDHVEQGRCVGAERPGDGLLEVAGLGDPAGLETREPCATAAMSGLSSSVPNSGSPPCSCSSLTMPSRPLSNTTTRHRQAVRHRRAQVAEQHHQPAVAAEGDHLPRRGPVPGRRAPAASRWPSSRGCRSRPAAAGRSS